MYEHTTAEFSVNTTQVFQGTRSISSTQPEPVDDDPEEYISTRRLNAGVLREMLQGFQFEPEAETRVLESPELLERQAQALAQQGDPSGAFSIVERVYSSALERLGQGDVRLIDYLVLRGAYAVRSRLFEQARICLLEALDLTERHYGYYHVKTAACYRCLGVMHRLVGDDNAARLSLTVALKICSQVGGSATVCVALTLGSLGNLERGCGALEDAIRHYGRARELFDGEPGMGEHPGLAGVLHGLGAALLCSGQVEIAASILERAHAIRMRISSTLLQRVGTSLLYGQALWEAGRTKEGYEVVREALSLYNQHPKPTRERTNVFLDWLESHGPEGAR